MQLNKKRRGEVYTEKEEIKLVLFVDEMIVYGENPKEVTKHFCN